MENVLITGANRGIGLELTRCFAANGDHVIATCRDPDSASELQALAADLPISVHRLAVTDGAAVDALHDALGEITLDILINNAGIMGGRRQSTDDMDYDAWLEAFAVNTLAPFRLVAKFRDNLRRAERPRVVTLSSQMGALGRNGAGAYAYRSSKAAVNKTMQVLAGELAADGIIVVPIHPGWVQTDMGGPQADITAVQSAQGIHALARDLTMDQSGRFWNWNGEEHVW